MLYSLTNAFLTPFLVFCRRDGVPGGEGPDTRQVFDARAVAGRQVLLSVPEVREVRFFFF